MKKSRFTTQPRPLVRSEVPPERIQHWPNHTLGLDFGKAAFGSLLYLPDSDDSRLPAGVVHLGEQLGASGRIEREPPGSIRYRRVEARWTARNGKYRLTIPPDQRNTGPAAIPMPDTIGEVMPFRFAELEGVNGGRFFQERVHTPFDDQASDFRSSDETLNAVWDLCKYSIKATSFCGVYVDGDRERIPYEGDAFINQLGHYCTDQEYALARYTHEYLIQYPTWVTEWILHSVLMAWADYEYTGETESLEEFYSDLKAKTLLGLAREDGLISTHSEKLNRDYEISLHLHHDRYIFPDGLKDLVDWPKGSFNESGIGERDGHEMLPLNTVINAFHYRALVLFQKIASALGKGDDARAFEARSRRVYHSFNRTFWSAAWGVYRDGEGSGHSSLHSNLFALTFGLVPQERLASVLSFMKSRGMACSVYGAQHLLDGLYQYGESEYALGLLTARHDRSWWNMLRVGSTITLEAWDWKYKNNLDWNHAWGAAPANIIPRWLMGIQPGEPGFRTVTIRPQPGGLKEAYCRHPTPLGPVEVTFRQRGDGSYMGEVTIPESMQANLIHNGKTDVVGAGKHCF